MTPEAQISLAEAHHLIRQARTILSPHTKYSHRQRIKSLRIAFGVSVDKRGSNGGKNKKMTKSI